MIEVIQLLDMILNPYDNACKYEKYKFDINALIRFGVPPQGRCIKDNYIY